MKKLRRMAAFLTALILCLGLSVTAFAAEAGTGFSDVDAGDWYAEAAAYCRDNGLMAGTGETTFSPDTPMTRGMLVTVLYRLAGSPSLEHENLGYYRQNHDTWIQVYQVKMKNYKRIPIAEGLYRIMEVYIKTHQIGPDDYLFTNKNGGPYRSMTFRHQMKKFCEDHEIDGGDYLFQSHDYRHTVATMLYDNGVSIQGVRDYLGHDYLEMTEQYIDYMPKKIAKENMGFFQKPEHNLAAGLRKKGGRDGK